MPLAKYSTSYWYSIWKWKQVYLKSYFLVGSVQAKVKIFKMGFYWGEYQYSKQHALLSSPIRCFFFFLRYNLRASSRHTRKKWIQNSGSTYRIIKLHWKAQSINRNVQSVFFFSSCRMLSWSHRNRSTHYYITHPITYKLPEKKLLQLQIFTPINETKPKTATTQKEDE